LLLAILLVIAQGQLCGTHVDMTEDFTPRTSITIEGTRWLINGQPTHAGSPAEGLLMNVRMINAVFEDAGPEGARHLPQGFDPDANTDAFLTSLADYIAHGVRAFTIGLQGGLPGYEGAVNSAFEADGSLRTDYMRRVARVIEACDAAGAAVILSCFYQRQRGHERALTGREAVLAAVENAAAWVRDRGYTNVVLEVANEYPHGGFRRWPDGDWFVSEDGQVAMIQRAKRAAPALLVSTSGVGDGRIPRAVAEAGDFVTLHFNNTPLEAIPQRIAEARQFGKPVLCNEDNKVGQAGAEAARLSVKHQAGWGLMHHEKNQYVPFEFDGSADDPVVYAMLLRLTSAGTSIDALVTAGAAGAAAQRALTVLIHEPRDGQVYAADEAVTIRAAVQSCKARQVDFFANGQYIGRRAQAPWELTWHAPAGAHDLHAVAVDGEGQQAESPVVDITVDAVGR
jgi:hypothetical protein